MAPIVFQHGIPFRTKKSFTPPPDSPNALSISEGEEGMVWRQEGDASQVTIDRSHPLRVGWVPSSVLEQGCKPGGSIVEIVSLIPQPDYGTFSGPIQGASILKATLDGLLSAMRDALLTTDKLNFMTVESQDIIKDVDESTELVSRIIGGMPPYIAGLLCRGTFSLGELLQAETVSQASGPGLYFFYSYFPDRDDGIYVGQSQDMWDRYIDHLTDIKSEKPDSHHHLVVKGATEHRMFPITGLPADPSILCLSEQLFVLLGDTYVKWLFMRHDHDGTTDVEAKWVTIARHATTLTEMARGVFQQTGWQCMSRRLGFRPLNVTSPSTEMRGIWAKNLWMRKEGQHMVEWRRDTTRVMKPGRTGSVRIRIIGDIKCPLTWKSLPNIGEGTLVYVCVELRTDGSEHPAPFGRLPLVGGYADWKDCARLGIRMEWETPKGWRATYLQRQEINHGEQRDPPGSYVDSVAILAALSGHVYSNPSQWRLATRPARVIATQNTNVEEPRRRTLDEVGEELRQLGFLVSATKPKAFRRLKCDTCILGPNRWKCVKTDPEAPACNICLEHGRPCTWTHMSELESRDMAKYVSPLPRYTGSFRIDPPVFLSLESQIRAETDSPGDGHMLIESDDEPAVTDSDDEPAVTDSDDE